LSVLYARESISNFELCLLLETMSFEFMLSRCSRAITGPLSGRYAISQAALHCFELHTKADVCRSRISKCGGISSSLAAASVPAISLTGAGFCQLELRTPTAERRRAAGVT
jgi:hypothetical protein